MKQLLTFLLVAFYFTGYSQDVKILNQADVGKLPSGEKFTFIEPATDTTNFKYVATLQGKDRIRNANIETLYFEIREKANTLGANCYKLKSYYTDEVNAEVIMILDAFYATDSLINLNRLNHERNVVYLFGNEKSDDKSVSFVLNGETKNVQPGTYYKLTLKEGEEFRVSKGGLAGTLMKLKYQKDKLPAFYSFTGFGLNSWEQQPINGISFKSGGINRIENISLGLLMINLLKQGN